MRRNVTSMSRHGGTIVSRASRSRNTTPHRSSSCRATASSVDAGSESATACHARRVIEPREAQRQKAAPIGRGRSADAARMFGGRKAPLRIDERPQVLEAVGRHQARGCQLPERIFDNARQQTRVSHDIGEKRRAATIQRLEHLARSPGQSLISPGPREAVGATAALSRRSSRGTAGAKAAASSSHEASSRRKSATGADRVGRTRLARPALPRSLIVERRMRREPAPHDFAGKTQLIEQLGRVLSDYAAAAPRLPTPPRRLRSPAAAG